MTEQRPGRPSAPLPPGRLVAWYGDDFTGSAATLEVLAFAGLPSVLFFNPPTPKQLARFDDAKCIGIASTARAHPPQWMDANLPMAFQALRDLNARVNHYKVCSTLDSSPTMGSIGRAIDIGADIFEGSWIPVLIAAPAIRRYQMFGNLFAAAPDGVHRLDRHPVMARHPATPMDEADVGKHLAMQTRRQMGLIDIEDLDNRKDLNSSLRRELDEGADVLVLDTVDETTLRRCGQLIWEHGEHGLFAVGSQGIEYALVAHWREQQMISADDAALKNIGRAARTAVVSGSVSSVTQAQINWSMQNGFHGIALDVAAVITSEKDREKAKSEALQAALQSVANNVDPLIYTAIGPDDPAIAAFLAARDRAGCSAEYASQIVGETLGDILSELIRTTGINRAVISGGDTSGYGAQRLGIFALTALAPTVPGAAIFRAHSDTQDLDGLQIALKGGQMGSTEFFGSVRAGGNST